jgi:hypothetical protein
MNYAEALKVIAAPDHGGARIRRGAWPGGVFVRRSGEGEAHLGHPYASDRPNKKPSIANVTPEDIAADDWVVEGAEPEAKAAEPEPKPKPSHAPPAHDDDDTKKAFPRAGR